MNDKQTDLQRLLEEGYRTYPPLREMMEIYEEANDYYQRALAAMQPKYVIVDSDTSGPLIMP
jgi:hypothetical protein